MDLRRARSAGLTMRPLSVTLADTLQWYRRQPEEHQNSVRTSWGAVATLWSDYLQREKEVLK